MMKFITFECLCYLFITAHKIFLVELNVLGGWSFKLYKLFDNLLFIPEINTSFIKNLDFNSSLALMYFFQPEKLIDLYYSNAVGIQSLGQLL